MSKSPASCAAPAAEGDFATVMRKGDAERGSLLLFVSSRGRHVACLERVLGLDGELSLASASARPNRRVPSKLAISSPSAHGSTRICGQSNWISRTPERFIAETTSAG